ncbi:Sex peptide receptor [Sarcoptes scabiei]|uniref:Sex peptide receptor n=1 Tax=Sarcoptes scabiei TaxID=52283 RepID=A0A834VEM2_SARSC|nr:Sex peptide receptor [Sarcoptes scabiei]
MSTSSRKRFVCQSISTKRSLFIDYHRTSSSSSTSSLWRLLMTNYLISMTFIHSDRSDSNQSDSFRFDSIDRTKNETNRFESILSDLEKNSSEWSFLQNKLLISSSDLYFDQNNNIDVDGDGNKVNSYFINKINISNDDDDDDDDDQKRRNSIYSQTRHRLDGYCPMRVKQNLTFLLNISKDLPDHLSVILFGYILPNLFVLTIITNLLIVVVLSQTHMRTPTNLVLLAMAISDLLTLLIPSPWYIYLFTFGHHHESIYPVTTCYTFHWMYEVLPALFHTYSIWLTLLLATQRNLTLQSMRRLEIRLYLCMSFLFGSPLVHYTASDSSDVDPLAVIDTPSINEIFRSNLFASEIYSGWKNLPWMRILSSEWVIEYLGEDFYYIYYYGFRIVFVHTGPCILLVWLNHRLFKALRQTRRTRKRLLNGWKENVTQIPTTMVANPTTMMSMVMMTTNNASMTMNTNNNALDDDEEEEEEEDVDDGLEENATNLSNELEHLNDGLISTDHKTDQLKTIQYDPAKNFADFREKIMRENLHTSLIESNLPTNLIDLEFNDQFESSIKIPKHHRTSLRQSNQQTQIENNYDQQQIHHQAQHQNYLKRLSSSMRINRLDSRSTTIMLIMIVSMFLLLEIPLALTTILHVIQNAFQTELVSYSILNTIIMMTNFFIIVSYPINFAIYCGMSRQFRITFYQSILRPVCKQIDRLHSRIFHVKHLRRNSTIDFNQQNNNVEIDFNVDGNTCDVPSNPTERLKNIALFNDNSPNDGLAIATQLKKNNRRSHNFISNHKKRNRIFSGFRDHCNYGIVNDEIDECFECDSAQAVETNPITGASNTTFGHTNSSGEGETVSIANKIEILMAAKQSAQLLNYDHHRPHSHHHFDSILTKQSNSFRKENECDGHSIGSGTHPTK